MKEQQIHELLYQALETEIGGQKIYATAISCASNEDLKEEWQRYLDETAHHEEVLRGVFQKLNLDPEKETPGREAVRHIGQTLVDVMETAKSEAPADAQVLAAECVVLAETKDHQNWRLIRAAGEEASGKLAKALTEAAEEVEDQEDEHLYHTMGWARELWLESLGVPAVLPPPEEERDVKTAIGAGRAANARKDML